MIRFLILVISTLTIYANYKVFVSFKVQLPMTQDFNTNNFRQDNYLKLQNLDRNFPNLSATGFPMNEMLAKYHLRNGKYYEALNLMKSTKNSSPFMRVRESLLAEAYSNLGIRDSSYYYSKEAYENLPGNSRHFQQYIAELTFRKDLNEIKKIFKESKFKHNSEYWNNFFAGVMYLAEGDKEIDSLANLAMQKFPSSDKIRRMSVYILDGQDNVRIAYQIFAEGISAFENQKYNLASEKFIKAIEYSKLDYSFYENAGMSLVKAEKFEESRFYFNKVINDFKTNDGKSEYGLATAYSKLGDKEQACKYFELSKMKNFKPAFKDSKTNCSG